MSSFSLILILRLLHPIRFIQLVIPNVHVNPSMTVWDITMETFLMILLLLLTATLFITLLRSFLISTTSSLIFIRSSVLKIKMRLQRSIDPLNKLKKDLIVYTNRTTMEQTAMTSLKVPIATWSFLYASLIS